MCERLLKYTVQFIGTFLSPNCGFDEIVRDMNGLDDRLVAIRISCPVLVWRRRCHDRMRPGVGYAALVAVIMCALTACEDEDYTTTYRVPSPSGTKVALKTYSQLSTFKYTVSIQEGASETDSQPTTVMTGFVPGGATGGDATLLSWRGNDHLDILIPDGGRTTISRVSVGSLSITYDHYDPKSSVEGKNDEGVHELQQVMYEAREKSDGHLLNCSIAVQGVDAQSRRRVGMVLNGVGVIRKYLQGEFGTFIASFFVSNIPIGDQNSLTLSQTEIEGIPMSVEGLAPAIGPAQDSTTNKYMKTPDLKLAGSSEYQIVRFEFLQRPVISAIFDRLRKGSLGVVYKFGNNEQSITYKFSAPIDSKTAKAYQECEEKARIFFYPVGSILLDSQDTKEK